MLTQLRSWLPTAGLSGIWLIAAFVAALAAAGVTWLIRRPTEKDTKDEENQGKVMVMETIEDTDREVGTDKETKKPSRGPTVLIVVLAVALVGLVAWMVFMMRPNSPTAAPPEIVQLMEDYTAAWNAHDADALEALVTDGYRIYSPATQGFDHDMESVRSYVFPHPRRLGLAGLEQRELLRGEHFRVHVGCDRGGRHDHSWRCRV